MKNLVIIPTYNEAENIDRIIYAVLQLNIFFDVLIVDDGSKDGTQEKVIAIQKSEVDKNSNRVFMLVGEKKQGLGNAYIKGFNWAIEKKYDYICEMDADFSHNPKDLERLINACLIDKADVSIGSRYVKGGDVKNWDFKRIMLSKIGSLYTRLITFMPIKDSTAGFICYSSEVLKKIEFNKVKLSGYGFQIEMKFRTHKKKFKIIEIPITFIDREYGVSKMNSNIIVEAIWGVLKLQYFSFFNKL